MMTKLFSSCLVTVLVLTLPCMAMAKDPEPDDSTHGLELVKKTWRGEFYMDTGADWNRYTGIQLEKATVAFRKNWARDQRNRSGNRPTEENMGRIKTNLSDLLDQVLRQELTKDGVYTISETRGENVMRITPEITNLNINAPDRMRDYIGSSYADSKGSMTLELEIHDAVSGRLLARMRDNREDPQRNYLEWTTAGTNLRAARLMFIRWAKKLHGWLIEARSTYPD